MRQRPHLVLFFTRHTSLQAWDEIGIIPREAALYGRLVERGYRVTFVTYGSRADLQYADAIAGAEIVCNRWNLPERQYRFLLVNWYPRQWGPTAIFKSNQVQGADVAAAAAKRWNRPFVARCGYLRSDFCEQAYGQASPAAVKARRLEAQVFGAATHVSVTTRAMANRVLREYAVEPGRVSVVPNYVDTRRFVQARADGHRRKPRLVFVGRLSAEKNLPALFDAIAGLDVDLVIVGNDVLREELEAAARDRGLPVTFRGNIPNNELPAVLAEADVFVLPSFHEGHPKVLLEAMACGLPIVATNVTGTSDVIRHRENGWLCGTSAAEIRTALQTVLADPALRRRLGSTARADAVEHYALDRIIELETRMLVEAQQTFSARGAMPALVASR